MAIPERAFFNERPETRPANLPGGRCQHLDSIRSDGCGGRRKIVSRRTPTSAIARYHKLRDYLVRPTTPSPARCRSRIEIPSHQSLIFLEPGGGLPTDGLPVVDEEEDPNQYTPGSTRQRTRRA